MSILYALLGMVCWGVAPIFGKLGLCGVNPAAALSLRTLIAAMFVMSWVIFTRSYGEVLQIPLGLWVFLAVEALLAALIGDLAFFTALKYGNVNVVTLVMACAPLVTIAVNYFCFGDVASWRQLVGAFFITVGLVLVCLE